ncbi:MAG TPA: DUF167 domain-containing protein [Dehalococcoidia bacterium]|jgi:hypothetical protein|nr:DUF167 domain-containing protein [Dehalococcoidia bacterium]
MADGAVFVVRVTPRAGRDEVVGWRGEELRVRLRAPPVEGQANEALRRLLADRLGVAPSSIELITGAAGRTKRLRVAGMSLDEVRERLPSP